MNNKDINEIIYVFTYNLLLFIFYLNLFLFHFKHKWKN